MSKSGLSHGLNYTKKPGLSKPGPPKRKPIFGSDDDSDDEAGSSAPGAQAESISQLDSFSSRPSDLSKRSNGLSKPKNGAPRPATRAAPISQFGDLSSALESRKYAAAAEEDDPSIYDYDAFHDSYKVSQQKAAAARDGEQGGGGERRSRYMTDLKAMAKVRERDKQLAEDKKIAREREAEGDEFADQEKFVTEAYKRQQEENKRQEEEERRREEEERAGNKTGGMTGFYKQMLDRGEKRHAEIVRAAEERQRDGGAEAAAAEEEQIETAADKARKINEKGGSVAINEDGQVVDKRELLRGGLNVGARKREHARKEASSRASTDTRDRDQGRGYFGEGGKQAMRDRQSRMLEAQYEQALKRARDDEEEERQKVELAAKSRKTDSEISSAKERYLARKRAAEEAKKSGLADP